MAVAIVQQQQQPNDKITIDLNNSKVVVNKDNKQTNSSKKEENNSKITNNNLNTTNDLKESHPKTNVKVKDESTVKNDINNSSKKNTEAEIKKEVASSKPVMETIKLPTPKPSRFISFALSPYDLNGYASEINKKLYEYEKVKSNQAAAMKEAIRLHNGDPSNTCVFFQSSCLRAIGVPVPNNIGYTSVLWNWLEDNNWEMHRDFGNIQKGDIIFAGEYHTMCFMGWKDKANGIAYVMGNEAYTEGESYSNRNMNGQSSAEENGWNNQYKATRYYKYKGTQIKGDPNSDTSNMSNVVYNSEYHKFTVTPLKGSVIAKQDVYINEKPFPTSQGIKPIGLAHGKEEFSVIGKTSNGWYEVLYKGEKGYISNKYTNYIEEKDSSKDKQVNKIKPKTENKPVTPDKTIKPTDNTNKKEKSVEPITPSKPSNKVKPTEPSKPAEKIIKTAYIKANGGLWLHSSPNSSSSSRMSLMGNGEKVTILDKNDFWFKVNYNGNTGWCSKKYLSTPTEIKIPSTKPVEPSKPIAKPNKPAESNESNIKTAYVKANSGLWLHSNKDSYISSRLTIMEKDSKVIILEESGSWFKVNYNGKTGWCAREYLTSPKALPTESQKPSEQSKEEKPSNKVSQTKPNKPSEASLKTAYIKATGGLWLHSSPDSHISSRLTIMNNGEKVQILDESGSWYKVNYNGKMGWCSSKFLSEPSQSSKASESKPNNQVTPTKPLDTNHSESKIESAYIKANGGLWLHSTMSSSSSSRMTIMGNGEKVTVLEKDGSWFKVNYNGNIGWCSREFLSSPTSSTVITTPNTQSLKVAYIKANGGLWLHSVQNTSPLSRITIMTNGEKVKILEESGAWYKVDYNGNIGWCSSKFIH